MAGRGNGFIPDAPGTNGHAKNGKASSPGSRTPPNSPEAERGVLGSLFLAPWYMDEIWTRLSPDDFYDSYRSQIYLAMRNIHAAGRKIDASLVLDRLKRGGSDVEAVLAEAEECFLYEPHAENVFEYTSIVRDMSTRRGIIKASLDAIAGAYDTSGDTKSLIGNLESSVYDLTAIRSQDQIHKFEDVVKSKTHRMKNKKPRAPGLKFGMIELDGMLEGLERGHVNLIAALTSVGKTALATTFCAHQLLETDAVGHFCSLEMSEEEVMERIVANIAEVDYTRFRQGTLDDRELAFYESAQDTLLQANRLWIDHAANRTVQEVISLARKTKRAAGRLDYVVIDFLQLLDSEKTKATSEEQLADIARRLKVAAKELDAPLIVMAQLNRQAEDGARPRLRHLRGSGAIEQNADKVILIERSTVAGEAANSKAVFYVDKVRHGKTGDCQVAFFGNYQRFQTYVENEKPEAAKQREIF